MVLEKIPAACGMEWSIHLDKCLRSKIPGKAIEGIIEIGSRLEWWNSESKLTMAEYKMFGLIPDEEKLFLNAILLRLADAFRLGDKPTKICVVRVFLSLRKRSRNVGDEGVLCKDKLENCEELLRRVKIVFDNGDVEERALALGLFGCWANIAKDSAHIRYLILSSLVSGDVLEVKASLFAAGCFCEMADDFASVFLEILVNILVSCETTSSIKLAAGRAFAKLWRPIFLADRAYKTGLKLASNSSDEDFAAVMLISLSKIASKWTTLIPGQIEIIFSFLSKKTCMKLQLAAVKCLNIVLSRGVCSLPLNREAIHNLLNVIDESTSPLILQCEALKILYKILPCYLPEVPDTEVLAVVSKLFKGVKDIIQNSVISKRLFAFHVLIDISKDLSKVPEVALIGNGSTVASQLVIFVIDRISLHVESNMDARQFDTTVELECKSLLNLLFNLVKENSDLAGLMLEKIFLLTENLVKMLERIGADLSDPNATKFGKESRTPFLSNIMLCLSKLVATCLEDHPEEVSIKVLNVVKLLVKFISHCNFFDAYTHTVYFLLLHSLITNNCMWHETDKVIYLNGSSTLHSDNSLSCDGFILEHENLVVAYAKKVLGINNHWYSYKIGKYAACRGVWSAAAFLFEQLIPMVQSDHCGRWLKTLTQISHSERKIELLGRLHSEAYSNDREEGIVCKINPLNSIKTLHEAHNNYLLCKRTLATSSSGIAYCFQIWLLTLRAKVLGTVANVVDLVHQNSFASDNASRNGQVERSKRVASLVYPFAQVSNQLKNLALEFDLLAMSFISMDHKSMIIISVLALSCSLLAFITGFAGFIQYPEALESIETRDSEEQLRTWLIQDLVGRLWHLDRETCTNVRKLLKDIQGPESFSLPHSRKQIGGTCCEARPIVKLCKYAVTGILGLQNKADKVQGDEGIFQIYKDGLEILLNTISIWLRIPFKIPNQFFRVRPCLSCELYVTNEEGSNVDGISVISGFNLPLNLCLQMRNMPSNLPVQLIKLYCILSCTRSLNLPAMQKHSSILESGAEDMVDLHVRLLQYVTGLNNISRTWSTSDGGNNWVVDKFVCFQPNERGQGFSSCLLDLSTFPVGSYKIKWLSCCIDSRGSYWNLLPLNAGPVFSVQQPSSCR